MHGLLAKLSLPHVAKTSGATGLQVFIPITGGHTYAETRIFTSAVAKYMETVLPDDVTLERLTRDRGEKVYFDYMQHGQGRTLIAPYSPRARESPNVSAPVTWKELESGSKPEDFSLHHVPLRVQKMGDLFDFTDRADLHSTIRFLHRHGSFA